MHIELHKIQSQIIFGYSTTIILHKNLITIDIINPNIKFKVGLNSPYLNS
jgi:hypothetical protein